LPQVKTQQQKVVVDVFGCKIAAEGGNKGGGVDLKGAVGPL